MFPYRASFARLWAVQIIARSALTLSMPRRRNFYNGLSYVSPLSSVVQSPVFCFYPVEGPLLIIVPLITCPHSAFKPVETNHILGLY
jgi:hypothetical protein